MESHWSNLPKLQKTLELGLNCPQCQVPLSTRPEGYVCGNCGDQWNVESGVIMAPGFDRSRYWGEIPRGRMQHILHRAEVIGPTRALEEWCLVNRNPWLDRYAFDWRRALCVELVDLPEQAAVLDYGCGYGTVGLTAASKCKRVYLVDSTLERIRFAQWRAAELGASNVVAIATQDWRILPLQPASLDLIILNGVLEWVPMTVKGDPHAIQLEFLASMRNLLKPGGSLYVGMENRYAIRYFGRYPDDHTGIRYTSIFPRAIASLVCKVRGRGPYRTLTWSLGEHRKVLARLGFRKQSIYCMFPDYRFPEAACRIDQTALLGVLHGRPWGHSLKTGAKRIIEKAVTLLHLWPWLVYSYGVVSGK